ncbi:MAG TPA: hypothetical protein VHQ90_23675 [Thermoanaerobaculia bacterium]|nr:hypothetical protein [Thermoanaerobaculia bacterium]
MKTESAATRPAPDNDLREPKCLVAAFFGLPGCKKTPAEIGGSADAVAVELSATPGKVRLELPLAEGESTVPSLQILGRAATEARYRLAFIIALVPDPLDSQLPANFDQTIDAINAGLATDDYLQDRIWLPWRGASAARRLYERSPGLMLFRKVKADQREQPELMLVFLVGETQKIGIHKRAFLAAMSMIKGLTARHPGAVKILGPAFSGSAESLRMTLAFWRDPVKMGSPREADVGGGPPAWQPQFHIFSGSATAKNMDASFTRIQRHCFSRALARDDTLLEKAFPRLAGELGWDRGKVVLLVEGDTAYGRSFDMHKSGPYLEVVHFPSRVAGFRTARERDGTHAGTAVKDVIEVRRADLSLSLAEQGEPVDLVPDFSAESSRSTELAIANLLEGLARRGARYVGIVATDVKDTLFLAEKVRGAIPQAVLFTFDSNLLEAHPQFDRSMKGMLVFANAGLFPEVFPESAAPSPLFEQFASEAQQGTFLGIRRLLGRPVAGSRIWMSVVGNGSFWPLASVRVRRAMATGDLKGCAQPESTSSQAPPAPARGPRGETAWLAAGAVLLLLAYWLFRAARTRRPNGEVRHLRTCGRAASYGYGALLGMSALLLAAYALAPWSEHDWFWRLRHLVGFAALGALHSRVAWLLSTSRPSGGRRAFRAVLSGLFPLGVAIWVVAWLWLPGGWNNARLLYLRLAHPMGGFSPLVPMACLGLALYAAALVEAKRRVMDARHMTDWPLVGQAEPQLASAGGLASRVSECLESRRSATPASCETLLKTLLAILAVPLLVALSRLFQDLQPIAEPRRFMWLFLLLLASAFVLAARSLYRFLTLWHGLNDVLDPLCYTWLLPALRSGAATVQWNPLRSFGWRMPSFKMMTIAVDKLKELEQLAPTGSGGVAELVRDGRDAMEEWLRQALQAESEGDVEQEITDRENAREEVNLLTRALEVLRIQLGGSSLPAESLASARPRRRLPDHLRLLLAIEEFLALRVTAYVRYVFAHLRYDLMGAVVPGLFVVLAVSFYAFEPKQFYSISAWAALLAGSSLILWSFAQMDRDAALSAIGNTAPGKVSFDRTFWLNLSNYGLIPLLGVLVTQFPQIGQLFVGWADPVLRALSSK